MKVVICSSYEEESMKAVEIFARRMREKPNIVLGLATGGTPVGTYKELIRLHKEEGLDFSQATTFNLDEYAGLSPSHPQSYRYFMDKNLFDEINIKKQNTHILSGIAEDLEAGRADVGAQFDQGLGVVDVLAQFGLLQGIVLAATGESANLNPGGRGLLFDLRPLLLAQGDLDAVGVVLVGAKFDTLKAHLPGLGQERGQVPVSRHVVGQQP